MQTSVQNSPLLLQMLLEIIERQKALPSSWNLPFCYLTPSLNISNMAASVNFLKKLSSATHTVLFESFSQSASMFGTVPHALQGLMLQNSHVWVFVVTNI